jgi:hypothetical protein
VREGNEAAEPDSGSQQMALRFAPGVRTLLAAVALAAPLSIATAHHSYAMFDRSKSLETDAVVRIWQFTNPHATLWVYINDAQGTPVLWALEAPGPQQLLRSGWDKSTVRPGDNVKVVLNPLRDGTNGGSLAKLTLADGRMLGMGSGGPPPAQPGAPKVLPPPPASPATAPTAP